MAHTVEDKILELADKYTLDGTDGNYRRNKEMLLEFAKALGIDIGDATYHIESLVRKSPVSEDLNQAKKDAWFNYEYCDTSGKLYHSCFEDGFVLGSKWKEEQLMKNSTSAEVGYFNQRGLSFLPGKSMRELGLEEDDNVDLLIIKR